VTHRLTRSTRAPPSGLHGAFAALALSCPVLRGYWEKLSVGGSVTMPLGPAPWGDTFGTCTDKFGVNWLVDIAAPGTSAAAPGS